MQKEREGQSNRMGNTLLLSVFPIRLSRGENGYDCSNREIVTISSMQIKAACWPDPGTDDGYVVHSYHVHPRVGRREMSR